MSEKISLDSSDLKFLFFPALYNHLHKSLLRHFIVLMKIDRRAISIDFYLLYYTLSTYTLYLLFNPYCAYYQ